MNPFLGEIRLFAGAFAPVDWAFCDGSLLQISANDALFTLVGTSYGGDGVNTFALPDLRGRVPIHQGANNPDNYLIGQSGGAEAVPLTIAAMPSHTHTLYASALEGTTTDPTGNVLAVADAECKVYIELNGAIATSAAHIGMAGGTAVPHENRQPFIAVNYIIATAGIFPSQG
jgi:microcystin-dependent protein